MGIKRRGLSRGGGAKQESFFTSWHRFLILTLFISIELNEREGYQRLSLTRVSEHKKARHQHRELRALLFSNRFSSVTSRRLMNNEDLRRGAYSLSSLSEKPRKSNHLQMQFKRQHFLRRYLKTLVAPWQ